MTSHETPAHTITIESPDALRHETGHPVRFDNGHVAPYRSHVVVERYDGRIVKVCAVVDEGRYSSPLEAYEAAERIAYGYRSAYNATSPVDHAPFPGVWH